MNLNELHALYNTLSEIEVRGKSVITMANCLSFMEQKIKEMQSAEKEKKNNEQ